ncbi:MAG: hypothetical protein IPK52_04230 [Chloroflexi bacterium]|nr:hypothetical protein [Chloroflexota bacterium]
MERNGKLQQVALSRGFSNIEEFVEATLEKRPSALGVATEAGVAVNAIFSWLSRNGYSIVSEKTARLVRKESA